MKLDLKNGRNGKSLPDEAVSIVIDELVRHIVIPESKISPQIIICPVGVVGSGKTTTLEMIGKEIPFVVVRTDYIRTILSKYGYNYLRVKELANILAERYVSQGYSIAADADFVEQTSQDIITSIVARFDVVPLYIHIVAKEAEILKRLAPDNSKRDFTGETAIADYKRRKILHENVHIDFFHTIETDSSDNQEQVNELIAKIKKLQLHQ